MQLDGQLERLLIEEATDYAVFAVDIDGTIISWSEGAVRMFRCPVEKAVGQPFSVIFTASDIASGAPERELAIAMKSGRATDQRWHVRADGELFYADGVTTSVKSETGEVIGFAKIARDATERKLREEHQEALQHQLTRTIADLEASQARLEQLYASDMIGIFVAQTSGKVLDANGAFLSLLGLSREDLDSGSIDWLRLNSPEHAPADQRALERIRAGQVVPQYEREFLHREGRRIPVVLGATPVNRDNTEIVAFVLDVIERKRVEVRLRVQHEVSHLLSDAEDLDSVACDLLRTISTQMKWDAGAMWTTDGERHLAFVDAWSIPGLAFAEFRDASRASQFARGADLPGRAFESRRPVWIEDLSKEESFPRAGEAARIGFRASLAFPIIIGDEVVGVIEFFSRELRKRDDELLENFASIGSQIGQFRERKRAEADLRASEERYRLIAETASDGIFTLDESSTILFANKAAEKIFGYTVQELTGQSMEMLMPEALRAQHHKGMARFLSSGEKRIPWSGVELPGLHRSGRGVPLELSFGVTRSDDTVLFTGIVRDISERKQVDRERDRVLNLERAARGEAEALNRERDQFFATITHELRTPMTSILGWVQILESGHCSDDVFEEAIDNIRRSAQGQAKLIDDMLDMSRLMLGKLRIEQEEVALQEVIEGAAAQVAPLAESRSVTLTRELAASPVIVIGDPDRIRQVLLNLLTNAIKFSSPDGVVSIRLTAGERVATIEVTDTGEGIDPEFLPRLFTRLSQAESGRHGGLGLGLAIVHQLVEAHGGSVRAQSEGLGRGSTFTVELPLGGRPSRAEG